MKKTIPWTPDIVVKIIPIVNKPEKQKFKLIKNEKRMKTRANLHIPITNKAVAAKTIFQFSLILGCFQQGCEGS